MTSKLSPLASGALALCVGVFCAGAHAQAKSRDEVRQELAQAVRDGTLMHGVLNCFIKSTESGSQQETNHWIF